MVQFKTRGKVSNEVANKLLNGAITIGLHHKVKPEALEQNYLLVITQLITVVQYHLSYDDKHIMFKGCKAEETITGEPIPARERVLPYEGWSVHTNYYHDGVNDSHWLTVKNQVKTQFIEEYKKAFNE